ncbi:hypothetical protein [Streptomyces sp. 150FB]|uniref:hypothetical protein n=1 Tax=Streptomyces sp. 150FB TaxID=1576605 RepID=UPI000A4660C4|nr:hypothetical protein [Streptomyces sp. 150FB]
MRRRPPEWLAGGAGGSGHLWSGIDFVRWKGSVYQWNDGRIDPHWHTVTHLWATCWG